MSLIYDGILSAFYKSEMICLSPLNVLSAENLF